MKKILSLALAAMLLCSLFGCAAQPAANESATPTAAPAADVTAAPAPTAEPAPAPSEEPAPAETPEPLYKAGVYTGSAEGFLGDDVIVDVSLSDNRIESVTVTQCNDSNTVCVPAVERIPARIVESQSLAVDVITTCSFTSRAILRAVEDCIQQAGGDTTPLWAALPAPEKKDETVQADVIIVGGGLAGLSAACELADNGKNVVLFEKLSCTGGSTAISGGTIVGWGGALHDAVGIEDSAESLFAQWQQIYARDNLRENPQVEAEAWKNMIEAQPDCLNFLLDCGAVLYGPVDDMLGYWGDSRWIQGGTPEAPANAASGTYYTDALATYAAEKGVTIYYECPVTTLTQTGSAVTGVVAEGKTGTVTANADAVILACGGYSHNPALVERFIPEIPVEGSYWSMANNGATGDGILMAEALGADVYDTGYVCDMSCLTVEPGSYMSQVNNIFSNLVVDGNGTQVVYASDHIGLYLATAQKETGSVQYILDADSASAPACAANPDVANIHAADSLEELANELGIDPAALAATVAAYNASSEDRIDTAPYYGVTGQLAWFETIGGLRTDDSFRVLSTEGNVIDGLYAVGALVNGKFCNQTYPGGTMLLLCTYTGRTAAQAILAD